MKSVSFLWKKEEKFMKKIYAVILSFVMLFAALAPAQHVEAAGKSLKASEKAFFKELKEYDYKGMNRYVRDWGDNGQLVPAFYMIPSARKYFSRCAGKMRYRIISTKKKGNKADVKVKFRYVNCEDFTLNFCMNSFYYMADGKLDNLFSMSDKQLIKLVNQIVKESQKGVKFNRFKTKTVTIRFVKTKKCWKVDKISDKLADVMMANFASNLQNLAAMSIPAACNESVNHGTLSYGTTEKIVLLNVMKEIYGRR